jgi:uncharacterized membrane protein
MADFSGTTSVSTAPDVLFDYLSDVGHLPDYFARMTSAERGDGEEVRTTARMPDGTEVAGDAWFRVDASARTLEWGSEGPSAYRGRLEVRPSGDGSEVEVHLHTTRVEDGDQGVTDGIAETLARVTERGEALAG